ncbi:hypothetical protein CR513_28069, partial [Mucuna pruriens]
MTVMLENEASHDYEHMSVSSRSHRSQTHERLERCDVIPMEVTHIFLGRPSKYYRRVTHDKVSNMFAFEHIGQKLILKNLCLKEVCEDQVKMTKEKEKREKNEKVEIAKKKKERRVKRKARMLEARKEPTLLVSDNICLNVSSSLSNFPIGFGSMLEEFKDVYPLYVPHRLPTLRGIKHHIDLTIGATLPNRATYRANLEESKESQRQVGKLNKKGWVRESISPCVEPIFLFPKRMAHEECA